MDIERAAVVDDVLGIAVLTRGRILLDRIVVTGICRRGAGRCYSIRNGSDVQRTRIVDRIGRIAVVRICVLIDPVFVICGRIGAA